MGEYVRVFLGDKLGLNVEEDFHEVSFYAPGIKMDKGRGYIKGEFVYVYRGKLTDTYTKGIITCGIFKNPDGSLMFVEPEDEDREAYHVSKVIELDMDSIFNEITKNEEQFFDPEDIEVINNNSEVYVPTIREEDDFLKYAIKKVIIDKRINLKNYRSKFSNQFTLNNMKGGLNKNTKMTVSYFKIWAEILGFKWKMTIEDDGKDKLNPLQSPIEITSDDF